MRRPISLWIFGIGGIITDLFSGAIFFMMFLMPAQAFFWNGFVSIILLLLLLLFISIIGLFRLKNWGKNIFVTITLIMNSLLILFETYLVLRTRSIDLLVVIDIILILFIISFIIYFSLPSTRKLFAKER